MSQVKKISIFFFYKSHLKHDFFEEEEGVLYDPGIAE